MFIEGLKVRFVFPIMKLDCKTIVFPYSEGAKLRKRALLAFAKNRKKDFKHRVF